MLVVYENDEEKAKVDSEEVVSGITPPTTNITKRKFEKTRKRAAFPVRSN